MASGWEALNETHQLDKLSLRDGIDLLIQAELDNRTENRIKRLIHNAHFKHRAVVEQLETDTPRGLKSAQLNELMIGSYLEKGMNIIITGLSGTGKSYVACALGNYACRQGKKVMYFTMNMLYETLKLVKLEGRLTNFFKKLTSQDLLIIDDFGMKKLEGEFQNEIIADACLDRIVHKSIRLEFEGDSLCKKY
jgi:DNA replication protein DnaC